MPTLRIPSLLALALILAACGGDDEPGVAADGTPEGATSEDPIELDTAAVTQASETTTVDVSISDEAITMPAQLVAGPHRFEVMNRGAQPRRFQIRGDEGVDVEAGPDVPLMGGTQGTFDVDLEPGTYRALAALEGEETSSVEASFRVNPLPEVPEE